MNLYQKIVEIKKSLTGFSKDSKSFGYTYVSGSQILRSVKEKMDELGVILVPEVDYDTMHWEKHNYTTAKGKDAMDFIVTMKMNYTWINAENPEEQLKVPWVCMGQQTDDISKAVGTAMTYNERYFLLKFLGLPTDEDDADNKEPSGAYNSYSKPKQTTTNTNIQPNMQPIEEPILISEAQRKRMYAISNGKDQNKVKDILSKYKFSSSKDVTKDKYKNICDEIEKL